MHLFETKRDFLTSNEYNGRICGAYYFARETQKRGRKVGQAQVNRQQNVPYRKEKIIYRDWSNGRGYSDKNHRKRTARRNEMVSQNRTGNRGGRSDAASENSKNYRINRNSRHYAVSGNSIRYRVDGRNQVGSNSGNYRRRRARKRKEYFARMTAAIILTMFFSLICFLTGAIYQWVQRDILVPPRDDSSMERTERISDEVVEERVASPEIIKNFLEINEFSRPGTELENVKSIFVHYTANPGTSAAQNRSYFSNLALTHETSASAHLIIGYDGEIVQCIPFDEQAYAVMTRNNDSISIECCYVSDDGSFTQETYDTLVHTLAWLLDKYDLTVNDILRHYDCGGKKCPIYYVEHEDAWERLLQDVSAYKEFSGGKTA